MGRDCYMMMMNSFSFLSTFSVCLSVALIKHLNMPFKKAFYSSFTLLTDDRHKGSLPETESRFPVESIGYLQRRCPGAGESV